MTTLHKDFGRPEPIVVKIPIPHGISVEAVIRRLGELPHPEKCFMRLDYDLEIDTWEN